MSTRTIGEFGASDSSGFLCDGSPATDTPVGNATSIGPLIVKPSYRLSGPGSTVTLSSLVGIDSTGMSRRNPVDEVVSTFRYVADGHGNMQPSPPSGLHSFGMPLVFPSSPHAAANDPVSIAKLSTSDFCMVSPRRCAEPSTEPAPPGQLPGVVQLTIAFTPKAGLPRGLA